MTMSSSKTHRTSSPLMNVEADVVLRSTAAVFTYCRSRGLFAGISLEGSYLLERKETNRKFYTRDIRASAILNGDVEPPSECYALYHILDAYAEAYTADWTSKNKRSVFNACVSSLQRSNLQLFYFLRNLQRRVFAFELFQFHDLRSNLRESAEEMSRAS
ncbi:hypothetical protein F2P81_025990 [Scophthalmus maximus]|uniref:Ysc84 actin-binding domain-containing protein n=1 Tax=Scophthalmus maximus TaxID=52904 RepID=A0A6A4RNQ3_SCOMX|nr:hypothetical protein F2P81_025990 [Scophthalmus maximus]